LRGTGFVGGGSGLVEALSSSSLSLAFCEARGPAVFYMASSSAISTRRGLRLCKRKEARR
jgi:hypothetical protein